MDTLSIILLIGCLLALYHLWNGAIFVPTDEKTVENIVRLLNIRPGMEVVDLGSGDGRIVVALARAGAEATGFENNPILFFWSWIKIKRLGLPHAQIKFRSFWATDLGQFDAVVVFGMTHIMKRLEVKLAQELRPGAFVISNIFRFPNWPIEREEGSLRVYRSRD
jgi:2-polyprenyl-3-methyl-5-hydroxy-6-metoxy-1,4-benzoquinol methylase